MNYDDYERFVALLVEGVKQAGRKIENLGCVRTNRIVGRSGQRHQIDVSFIDHSFADPTLVLIECKRVSNPVELSDVKVIKATLDDILCHPGNLNKGLAIIVATDRFRPGAQRFANFYGIRTQVTPHGLSFRFHYENIVQIGVQDDHVIDETVTVERWCDACGTSLVLSNDGVTFECPKCGLRGN